MRLLRRLHALRGQIRARGRAHGRAEVFGAKVARDLLERAVRGLVLRLDRERERLAEVN